MSISTPAYHLVIGLGASGLAMARYLHAQGKNVIATDIDATKDEAVDTLDRLGIETQIGYHDQKTFDNAQVMVPSPGIPLPSKYIAAALIKGVPLSCELDIFSQANTRPVIAITGTNGKTTTTTLIGQLLAACGKKPFVGGNIGTPLLEQLMSDTPCDIIVAEISSFQLDLSTSFKPDVALLLNISEDHLDRYPLFSDYEDSKWRLFENQTETDTAIINAAISGFDERLKTINSKKLAFSSSTAMTAKTAAQIDESRIRIRTGNSKIAIDTNICPALLGTHNHENIASAVLACLSVGTDIQNIKTGLKNYRHLPHRVEYVADINGISFYNDSKATNTDAVIRALACFDRPVTLILGGREKGTDFSQLVHAIKKQVKTIMAIGEAKAHIKQTFKGLCPVIEARDMADAVNRAFEEAGPGEVILLSPACASFDIYKSYNHRGDDFKSLVAQIGKKQ